DWLARHQDDDGRWNAAIARYEDGSAMRGDSSFTAHCPPGEVCSGECAYWEADTALTGLALLAYLGAGHTHVQGRYAGTVTKGLDFLLASQKKDGDLRGDSTAVGMYCHAMATLALCESYALTGDERLRDPATRAVAWLVRSRARDRMAWRYSPGEDIGDTSILGWVVMSLKSAREAGLKIPDEDSARRGALKWLGRVAMGGDGGLACYQPGDRATPTMTAEAWVCRQFLDAGGPGPASDEAADYLVHHENDRGESNFYYWYYATLGLYQDGGPSWARWNATMRDRIVDLQQLKGHRAGSWDPDKSLYGKKGGRIYCTALAAMTLEVYYRYLRLYDDSNSSSPPLEAVRPADPGANRSPAPAPSRSPSRRRPAASAALNPEDL
ncbi:MAG: prenyltransferase/squalene oxidase repeat-containing protein, partial [Isosphaeraceae bacterium]